MVFGALFTFGIAWNEYAVELDGQMLVDWRTTSHEERTAVDAGQRRLRVMLRHGVVTPLPWVVYDRTLLFGPGRQYEIKVDFAQQTVTFNGVKEAFIRTGRR